MGWKPVYETAGSSTSRFIDRNGVGQKRGTAFDFTTWLLDDGKHRLSVCFDGTSQSSAIAPSDSEASQIPP